MATTMTIAELEAKLALAQAENERLKAKQAKAQTLTCKVSEKKAVSVYGMGRFPITLYKGQWLRLFLAGKQIMDFIKAHDGELAQGKDEAVGLES